MLHPMMRHACEVCVCHSVCPSVVVLLVALLFDIALGWSVLSVSLLKVCWCRIGEERLLAWKFLLMLHPMMRHACEVLSVSFCLSISGGASGGFAV